jgi:predicted Zn-dependent protease
MRLLLTLLMIYSCSTTPTGRRQLRLIDEAKMANLGDQSYNEMLKRTPKSKSTADIRYVTCVTNALLRAMGERPSEWKVTLFEDASPNAFALPGNNMGVHTGMMKVAKNQHQLAAVIGHEIAHVKAHHGNERVSQNMVIGLGLSGASLAIGEEKKNTKLILAGLGLGAQFGVMLPFSRSHETEADILGQKYMAQAGFDPREAAKLWQNMIALGGSGGPEFMSTHPASDRRIRDLNDNAPKVMGAYQQSSNKPRCR